jgi:hypothetical protein
MMTKKIPMLDSELSVQGIAMLTTVRHENLTSTARCVFRSDSAQRHFAHLDGADNQKLSSSSLKIIIAASPFSTNPRMD